MGKYRKNFFSEAIALIEAGYSFYIGPIGSFYNQVNDTGS
jgi:hypothetical protein